MKKVDSNTLIQFIGMVGIMASLVFVGLQMRQSQQIALANLSATTTSFFLSGICMIKGILINLKKLPKIAVDDAPSTS